MLKSASLFFLLLNLSIPLFGQTETDSKALYKWFDATIGQENTGLLNGIEYRDLFKTGNESHKFYLSSSYQIGNIVYKGQPYFDIEMKYDIHDDQVIVRVSTSSKTHDIQLIKEKIDGFSIGKSRFIPINNLTDQDKGFYEVIFESSHLALYKQHFKTAHKRLSDDTVLYSFKNKEQYLLYTQGKYHKITKSKKSLIKLLPKFKQDINGFYKSQRKLLNLNYDLFIKNLIKELHDVQLKKQS